MNSKAKIIVVLFAFLGFASASYSQAIITGIRDLPDSYVPGQTITVSLDLSIDETRRPDKWGGILKDFVPTGWTFVSASRAPDVWDPATGELKWVFVHGLFGQEMTDTSMDISYQVTPPSGETGDKTFSGQILYNDPVTSNPITETIGGDTQISGPEPLPTVYFSSTSSNGSEAVIDVTLDVKLSATSDETVTVDYAVTGGTAAGEGEDYTLAAGTLTFAAGDTSENISITINDDSLDEENETIEVTLSNPSNATLGTNKIHTYTIQDNETQPSVEFDVISSEGPESVSTAELTVNLLPQSGLEVTVNYAVTGGDATGGGEDYTLADGTLTFSAGDTSEKIAITIINDLMDENNETIEVTLSSPTNAILGAKKIHTYTILEDNDDVPVIAFSSTGSQGDESVSPVALVVNLSQASAKTVTVGYSLSGDASVGVDYTIPSSPLTFAPGETTKNITLTIVDDGLDETNETVIVTLGTTTNANLGANKIYTYTINDDDIAGIGFALVSSSGSESAPNVTLDVGLSPAAAEVVTVNYSVSGGSADGGGVDYTLLGTGVLMFSIGDTSKEISISVVDDSIYEGDETIEVTLSNPTNAELGNNITHTYTIEDDESLPTVEFDVAASDGLEDNSPAELIVNISGESSQDVKVDYSVTPGTAKAVQDYTAVSGTLTFPAGETEPKIIKITIIDDELDEEDETFKVTLSNPTNANLGTPTSHTYTILDNDDPPEVSFTLPGKESEEGAVSQVTLVVKLSEESGRTVTVGYSVSGMATRGEDYILDDGTLTFSPGETTKNIILTILDDNDCEPAETVIVTLSAASETVEPGTYMEYTYKIINDDLPSVAFEVDSSDGLEADSPAYLTVTLYPALLEEVKVDYSVTGTAEGGGVDYTLADGTLTFSAGDTEKSIKIDITDDTEVEPDETIIVTLSNPTGALIGTNESHTYTILNDDDETLPEISGYIPEPDLIQVARDTIIQLHITDEVIAGTSGTGVALETVSITVEDDVIYDGGNENPEGIYDSRGSSQTVKGICRRVGSEEDYMFVFQSSTLFDYEQEVNVTVNAKDKAGNIVNETYHFHTVMRSFGKNIKVNSDTGTLVQNRPATATDSAGNIWVVWDETTAAGDTDIYIGMLPKGEDTFEESKLVFGGPNNQSNPAIAIDKLDMISVVWQSYDPDSLWDIYASSASASDNGTNWSEPIKVSIDDDDNKSNQTSPAIAFDGTGQGYVAWEDDRIGDKDIWGLSSGDPIPIIEGEGDQTEPFVIAHPVLNEAGVISTADISADKATDLHFASFDSPGSYQAIVKTESNQSNPVSVISVDGSRHLLWVDDENDDGDIFYGNDASGLPIQGINIVDEPGTVQSSPAIAVNGTKIFACWQDARWIDNGDVADIYFTESGSGFDDRTNVLINDDGVYENTQTVPDIGDTDVDKYGNPYIVWVDDRNGNKDIYCAVAISIQDLTKEPVPVPDDPNAKTVPTTQANLQVTIPNLDDENAHVDPGTIRIGEVRNLSVTPPEGGFGLMYNFGPSGLAFDPPATIRIPLAPNAPSYSQHIVYWWDSTILPNGAWTTDGIHNPATKSSDGTYLEVQVDHFSVFLPGGSVPGVVPGGGGDGGCAISPNGQGNVIEYMLPYVFYVVVLLTIKLKDARNRKTI